MHLDDCHGSSQIPVSIVALELRQEYWIYSLRAETEPTRTTPLVADPSRDLDAKDLTSMMENMGGEHVVRSIRLLSSVFRLIEGFCGLRQRHCFLHLSSL